MVDHPRDIEFPGDTRALAPTTPGPVRLPGSSLDRADPPGPPSGQPLEGCLATTPAQQAGDGWPWRHHHPADPDHHRRLDHAVPLRLPELRERRRATSWNFLLRTDLVGRDMLSPDDLRCPRLDVRGVDLAVRDPAHRYPDWRGGRLLRRVGHDCVC